MHIIIEGIDHIGKDMLIDHLRDTYGGRSIHSGKPILCTHYKDDDDNFKYSIKEDNLNRALYKYQSAYFADMFYSIVGNIQVTDAHNSVLKYRSKQYHTYYNRLHLGEYVYGKLYRNYTQNLMEHVFSLEREILYKRLNKEQFENIHLILLKMHHPENRYEDVEAFNFKNGAEEQALFDEAFNRSVLRKSIVYADTKDGQWRLAPDIVQEVENLIF